MQQYLSVKVVDIVHAAREGRRRSIKVAIVIQNNLLQVTREIMPI